MEMYPLEIITPERRVYSDTVGEVSVPTANGEISILAHHAALFTALTEGEVKIKTGTRELFLAIGGGFMEVTQGGVSILVARAYHADELNEAEIKRAEQAARDALKQKVKGMERSAALALLRRSTIEMKVMRRRRKDAPSLNR